MSWLFGEVKPGAKDEEVVGLAVNGYRVILTFDKEFSRYVLVNQNAPGVILLRISLEAQITWYNEY